MRVLRLRAVRARREELDAAAALGNKADDGAQQHRLAAAGRTDDAEDLAALEVEREVIEHGLLAETDHEIAGSDHHLVGFGAHPVTFRSMRKRLRTRRRAR